MSFNSKETYRKIIHNKFYNKNQYIKNLKKKIEPL